MDLIIITCFAIFSSVPYLKGKLIIIYWNLIIEKNITSQIFMELLFILNYLGIILRFEVKIELFN